MFTCGRCGDGVSEAIQCSTCNKHFDFPCSGITEKGYRKLGDRQATWRCVTCKNSGQLSVQSQTGTASPVASPTVTLDSIMHELTSIRMQLAPLSGLPAEVQLLRKELADLKGIHAKVHKLDERLTKVEKVQEDLTRVTTSVCKLEEELQDSDQWLRSNNIEIKGVPLRDKENLFEIVAKIGDKISHPVLKTQINFVHRVPSKIAGTKNIIVSFMNRYVKEDFIASARLLKNPFTPKDIGYIGAAGRIFINDHLTIKNKLLLSQAKSKAKDHNYQFVWVKHMKIFVRRDPTSKAFTIARQQDLQKIV